MTEILNGKNAKITALTLPYGATPTLVVLDNDSNAHIYVDSFSINVGTEVGEHEVVGNDQKIFSEGVQNAVVNLTIRMQATYNSQNMFDIAEAIKQFPINSDGAFADDTDMYWIEISLKNKAASVVAVLEPHSTAWAACEVGDIDFPANDIISIPLTLRYGELTWKAS